MRHKNTFLSIVKKLSKKDRSMWDNKRELPDVRTMENYGNLAWEFITGEGVIQNSGGTAIIFKGVSRTYAKARTLEVVGSNTFVRWKACVVTGIRSTKKFYPVPKGYVVIYPQ